MPKKAIYYDTETTGLKPDKDRIVEIAAYDPIEDRSFVTLVNPMMPIPEESTRVTGITDEMVKEAPTFAQAGQDFIDFCKGDVILIAHNGDSFDKLFLINECKRENLTYPNFPHIDSLKWARKYRPDLPKHPLQYLREVYQIEANNAHRALDDVIILHKIFSTMIGDLPLEEVYLLLYQQTDAALPRVMPFGKHRGEALETLPKSYRAWFCQSGALDKPENAALKESFDKLGLCNL